MAGTVRAGGIEEKEERKNKQLPPNDTVWECDSWGPCLRPLRPPALLFLLIDTHVRNSSLYPLDSSTYTRTKCRFHVLLPKKPVLVRPWLMAKTRSWPVTSNMGNFVCILVTSYEDDFWKCLIVFCLLYWHVRNGTLLLYNCTVFFYTIHWPKKQVRFPRT